MVITIFKTILWVLMGFITFLYGYSMIHAYSTLEEFQVSQLALYDEYTQVKIGGDVAYSTGDSDSSVLPSDVKSFIDPYTRIDVYDSPCGKGWASIFDNGEHFVSEYYGCESDRSSDYYYVLDKDGFRNVISNPYDVSL